jgi:Predicted amidophosphoribosyltransferases
MGLLDELLELVLPQVCAGCGVAPGLLCAGCREPLRGPVWPAWPSPAPPGLPTPYAAVPYEGAVRNMIVAHKESGRMGLARHLGAALALSVISAVRAPDQGQPPRNRTRRDVLRPRASTLHTERPHTRIHAWTQSRTRTRPQFRIRSRRIHPGRIRIEP